MSFMTQAFTSTIYPYAQIMFRNMGYSQSLVGVILALGQLAACICPLVVSNFADKTGKGKGIYFFSVLLIMVFHAIVVKWNSLIVVIPFYIVAYACAGCLCPLSDGIINRAIAEKGGIYSNYRAIGTIGYVIALTVFTLISFPSDDNNWQIITAMVILGVVLLCAIALNPDYGEKTDKKEKEKFFDRTWFSPGFYLFIVVLFFQRFGATVIEKLLSSFMTENLNLGSNFTIFVALGALSEFVFMLVAGAKLKEGKISEYQLIILSCIGLFARLLICSHCKSIAVFVFAQLLHCLTYGAAHIATISYISKNVDSKHLSLATAIYSSLATCFSQFLGALAGGFIIDNLGYPALFEIYSVFPLIALAICILKKNKIFSVQR